MDDLRRGYQSGELTVASDCRGLLLKAGAPCERTGNTRMRAGEGGGWGNGVRFRRRRRGNGRQAYSRRVPANP